MRAHRVGILLGAALALGALSSCKSAASAPGPEDFISVFASHACAAQKRCGLLATFNLAKCQELSAERYREGKLGFIIEGVKAGSIEYDTEQVSPCLSAVDSSACDGTADLLGLCEAVFGGKGNLDSSCLADDAGALACLGAHADGGTCATSSIEYTAKVAEACVQTGDGPRCGSNLACVPSIDRKTWQCTPRVAAGRHCREGYPNSCTPDSYCTGSFSGGGDGNGVCRPLPKAGEPCTDFIFAQCAYGLECSDHVCIEPGRIGDACASEVECINRNCVDEVCAEKPACP